MGSRYGVAVCAAAAVRSLPPCGGGSGRGVAASAVPEWTHCRLWNTGSSACADDDDRGCGATAATRDLQPTIDHRITRHNPTVKQPDAPRSLAATTSRSRRLFRARFDLECPALLDRGRRECRMRVAPVAACAAKKHRRQQPGVHRISRHSLHNGVTAYTRSPRGPGSLAPVACGSYSASLAPASGRQDHAISPSAIASFVAQKNCT
jgi:hypothetical protein